MPLAGQASSAAFDGNETRTLGGTQRQGVAACNNVNMVHFTTEVPVVLTSRPKYTTTSKDLGRETLIVVQVLVRRKLYRVV